MVLYSPYWTNSGFSFILLTVNLFRHSTLIEHGLYTITSVIVAKQTVISEVYVCVFCVVVFFNKISLKYINFIYSAD